METFDPEVHDLYQGFYHVYVENNYGRNTAVVDIVKLADALPHGSGIDGNWTITVARNGDVVCRGEYHAMNENGFYTDWRNFRFSIRRAMKDKLCNLFPLWTCSMCGGSEYAESMPQTCGHCKQASSRTREDRVQVLQIKGHVYFESFVGGGDASDYLYDTCYWAISQAFGIGSMESGNVTKAQ